MSSSTQQFIDAIVVEECIEQGIKSGRIFAPMDKRGFIGKKREIDHIKAGYKGKNTQLQKYSVSSS